MITHEEPAPSVLELIRSRLGGESDHFKLGLAVEGGGMRGIVSGAMLIALGELETRDTFDGFYGTSSGSINLAYFLTEQDNHLAMSAYHKHLVDKNFVSFQRKSPMDLGYLFNEVMANPVPLDYEAVIASPYRLVVCVSNVDEQKPEYISEFTDGDDLKQALRAGASLPVIAGGPYSFRGQRYLDGGVLSPLPFYGAIKDGCTHVLSIGTEPWITGSPRSQLSAQHRTLAIVLNRWSPGLGKVYLDTQRRYLKDKARFDKNNPEQELDNCQVMWLRTQPKTHAIAPLTRKPQILLDGAKAGYDAIKYLLA